MPVKPRPQKTPAPVLVPLPVLLAATRTKRFWSSLARHSFPVFGVFAFGWSPMNVGVFFLLESWLYITMRLTVELTFDPKYAGADLPRSRWHAVRQTIWMALMSSIASGVLVFGFGSIVVLSAFSEHAWREFLTTSVMKTSFIVGLGALFIDILFEGIRFQRGLLERTAAEKRADDRRVKVMFYRVVLLLMAFMAVGLSAQGGLGGYVLVILMWLVLVYFDVFPKRALAYFE